MNMIDDVFDNADEYNDYNFNSLLYELERNGEILRMWESGEIDPLILGEDDEEIL